MQNLEHSVNFFLAFPDDILLLIFIAEEKQPNMLWLPLKDFWEETFRMFQLF